MAEGYIDATIVLGTITYSYVYQYKDHLGNIRMNYTMDPVENELVILKESHYYPFGYQHKNYNRSQYMFANLGEDGAIIQQYCQGQIITGIPTNINIMEKNTKTSWGLTSTTTAHEIMTLQ